MEVATSGRQTKGRARNSPTDPRNERRQSALGRSPDPWRSSQTRHRRWPNVGRQVHDTAQKEKTDLRNHADGIASIDLCVVPTISNGLLYGPWSALHGRAQRL